MYWFDVNFTLVLASIGENGETIYSRIGAVSIKRCRLTGIGIPMLKIRRSHDRLIFNMTIPYLEKLFICRQGSGDDVMKYNTEWRIKSDNHLFYTRTDVKWTPILTLFIQQLTLNMFCDNDLCVNKVQANGLNKDVR